MTTIEIKLKKEKEYLERQNDWIANHEESLKYLKKEREKTLTHIKNLEIMLEKVKTNDERRLERT